MLFQVLMLTPIHAAITCLFPPQSAATLPSIPDAAAIAKMAKSQL